MTERDRSFWDHEDERRGTYGFRATIETNYDYDNPDGLEETALYTVELPHSCDAWVISKTRSKTQAVTALEQFITEAQNTLIALRAFPEEGTTP